MRYNKKHGLSRTAMYRTWQRMKARCANPNQTGETMTTANTGQGPMELPEWFSELKVAFDKKHLPESSKLLLVIHATKLLELAEKALLSENGPKSSSVSGFPKTDLEASSTLKVPEMERFVTDLVARWHESAPYGDQIPTALPALLADFARSHAGRDKDAMYVAFSDAASDDPILKLFECIFETAARFTINRIADAVYDNEGETLALVDLELVGALATPQNDPNPECEHQHIVHPNLGGRILFARPQAPSAEPQQPKSESGSEFSQTTLDEHLKHVRAFLTELHAIMIDPLAEGELSVKEMCDLLLTQARKDRETLSGGRNALNLQGALEESLGDLETGCVDNPSHPETLKQWNAGFKTALKAVRGIITNALQSPQAASDGEEHKKQSLGGPFQIIASLNDDCAARNDWPCPDFGFKESDNRSGELPDYCNDLNACHELIDLLADKGWTCELANGLDKTWECTFETGTSGHKNFRQCYRPADTLALAICGAFVEIMENRHRSENGGVQPTGS